MKRLALVAAVLVLAACTAKKDDAATADTSAPSMAPAPAIDSTMIRDSITRDSVRRDSIARATKR
jgi:uncharacterized lipoprotein YajG